MHLFNKISTNYLVKVWGVHLTRGLAWAQAGVQGQPPARPGAGPASARGACNADPTRVQSSSCDIKLRRVAQQLFLNNFGRTNSLLLRNVGFETPITERIMGEIKQHLRFLVSINSLFQMIKKKIKQRRGNFSNYLFKKKTELPLSRAFFG